VGRVSYIPGKGFTVEGNDPEVLEILRELEKLEDFSAADIDQNQDFIQDFIRQYRSTTPKKGK
jgi:Wiskott-Aldrich syndrome protein